jgi:hypothetical protein
VVTRIRPFPGAFSSVWSVKIHCSTINLSSLLLASWIMWRCDARYDSWSLAMPLMESVLDQCPSPSQSNEDPVL